MQQEIQIKNFDHLGLIAGMIDELGIVECIDKEIPKKSDDFIALGKSGYFLSILYAVDFKFPKRLAVLRN